MSLGPQSIDLRANFDEIPDVIPGDPFMFGVLFSYLGLYIGWIVSKDKVYVSKQTISLPLLTSFSVLRKFHVIYAS